MTTIKEHFHVAVPTAFNTDETINTTITIEHIINLKTKVLMPLCYLEQLVNNTV